MSTREDIMRDYVPVNERILAFYAKHPEGSLQSELVELNDHRVVMRAYAYRTPTDERPGIGYSSLEIPGRTPYTKGSEVENAETSAWGRAIAALGFEVKRGIASAEEVRNKGGVEPVERDPAGGLIGTVEVRKPPADMELRQQPDGGYSLGFGLVGPGGRGRIQVMVADPLASALAPLVKELVDQRVTCYGSVEMVAWKKGGREMPPYQRLHLSRIEAAEFTLPAPEAVEDDLSDLPMDWGPADGPRPMPEGEPETVA